MLAGLKWCRNHLECDLTLHEADPTLLQGIGVLKGNDFNQGLSSLSYDESLTLRSLLDEPRQMRPRFMNVYGLYGCLDGLCPLNLDGTKMTRATVLKGSTYRRMPWKNGAGETVEIAVSPEGAALFDFDWRISMATVATDGPFSIFPGIDRTLSILEGNGMSLSIDGGAPVLLTQDSDPLAFPRGCLGFGNACRWNHYGPECHEPSRQPAA